MVVVVVVVFYAGAVFFDYIDYIGRKSLILSGFRVVGPDYMVL